MDRIIRRFKGRDRRESCRLIQREDTLRDSRFRLTELPPDLIEFTLSFLTGFDLLPLSHVNREMYYGLLANDGEVWQRLAPSQLPLYTLQLRSLAPPRRHRLSLRRLFGQHTKDTLLPAPTAKHRYFARRSVRFHGGSGYGRRGAIPTPTLEVIASGGSFSYELEFALLCDADDGSTRQIGGVLLGAQSRHATYGMRASAFAQFVRVDACGNLYCSVMSESPIVAKELACERWYHVALVFDITGPSIATQRVYVDGELVHTAEGWLHAQCSELSDAQLGSGCMDSVRVGLGSWVPFNGLVGDCRFWNRALQPEEVRQLAVSGAFDSQEKTTPVWSMRDDGVVQTALGNVTLVRSTSRAERSVRNLETTGNLSTRRIPLIHTDPPRFRRRNELADELSVHPIPVNRVDWVFSGHRDVGLQYLSIDPIRTNHTNDSAHPESLALEVEQHQEQ